MRNPWNEGRALVEEVIGQTQIEAIPFGSKLLLFPVTPDEEKPVDLVVVKMSVELAELYVVVASGFDVNLRAQELVEEQAHLANKGLITGVEANRRMEAVVDGCMFQVGDILAVNKFSGQSVPGTQLAVVETRDVICKIRNFPVRLRTGEDDAVKIRERADADSAKGSAILVP